ncbi:MAG: glycoside hydrolase family 25 protein [Bacteroidales bacterium]|nr:glycoside hydrolase family 25 protein [Clostridium sp.]MCM1203501.1 glycoside hydrolase family 25 protein [Bacteroidales bacterium]
MKKYIILFGLGVCLLAVLSGCQRDYYGKGTPFQMSTSKLPGYRNDAVLALSTDNYERFMHASYILVTDKFGEIQKIKISANIKRHEWDFANLDNSGAYKQYIGADGVPKKIGVDVSEHQGVIDWAQVSGQVDFAIIRAGYRGYTSGGITADAYFSANMAGAVENNIPVGVYFYSQAVSYEEGAEEANFVLNQLGEYGLKYPVVLDREDPMQEDARTNNLSVEQHTQAALGFLETIQESGHRVMIYTNRMYYALYLDLEKIYQYPVWYAQYADEPDWPYEFSIWQYTESGEVPGIPGAVDLNIEMMPVQ